MDNLGQGVWCLVDVEVRSAKTRVCDCKKNGTNKSAIITKKKKSDTNK